MTLTTTLTGMMTMTGSRIHWPVISATTPSVAPSDSEPVSPMNISAGWTLYQRKAKMAPTTVKQKRTRKICPWSMAMAP